MMAKNTLRNKQYSTMELKVINKAFAIEISQSKLTAAKGELVVKQEKSAVYVKEVKEFNHDNEGIEELIKFLGEYKEGIIECFVGYFRIIQKFINNYTEYYSWERVSTRGIGASTTRTL